MLFVTRGPHSVQEVPDRVRPGRQFATESRKPFALPAKLTAEDPSNQEKQVSYIDGRTVCLIHLLVFFMV
ncbi:Uncharacterized protein APZ42_018872 [Daphnia magna]|uniref:Uncharacterized protein n=1 Tax=Daphnia magna TaxID=35525 RepID=A0A164YW04_9CRUS|nr:Uncharacterized protein APZ42_018872 [Daphnia magna]